MTYWPFFFWNFKKCQIWIARVFFSTHFWGPIANWGIPVAAIADVNKDAKYISGRMTIGMQFVIITQNRFQKLLKNSNFLKKKFIKIDNLFILKKNNSFVPVFGRIYEIRMASETTKYAVIRLSRD